MQLTGLFFSCLMLPIVMLGVWPMHNHPPIIRTGVTNGLHNLKVQGTRLESHVVYNSVKNILPL